MSRSRFVVLALLATVAWTGLASAQTYYQNCWGAYADGSMDGHYQEGYAITGEGNYRFSKLYHHMAFMGFDGVSDNSNHTRPGHWQGHADDGVVWADWLLNKKAFDAVLYFRDSDNQTCDGTKPLGTYLNSPVTVLGFKIANSGPFTDRGTDANGAWLAGGHSGCCAGYNSPLLDGGENAPPAWRMGRPDTQWTVMGYSQTGDIGVAGPGCTPEYYMASSVDSVNANLEIKLGNGVTGFGTLGFGGFSTNSSISGSGHFAFDFLVQKSDAMLVNSTTLTEADCSGLAGGDEPRDVAADLTFGHGWYAKQIDACIISALGGGDPECKGLVFSSAAVSTGLNTGVFGRDQSGGIYSPYIWVYATIMGDFNNDGSVDVIDLLTMIPSFGTMKGDPGFDPESDSNCDGSIDVIDLLNLISTFGQAL